MLMAAAATAVPRLPAGATVRSYAPAAIARVHCDGALATQPVFSAYLASIDGLRESMRRDRYPVLGVRRAFYPMAGYDAAILAKLFPRADVIAVDRFPAYPEKQLSEESLASREGRGAYYIYPDEGESTGPRVIGALEDMGFRIRGVHVFTVDGDTYVKRTRAYPNVHAVIEFDSGPDTPRRRYWQLQGTFPSTDSWWWKRLGASWLPDAVLVKGAHHLVENHPEVTAWLTESGGFVVEGANVARHASEGIVLCEFSGRIRADSDPSARAYLFPGRFGYGDSARVRYIRP